MELEKESDGHEITAKINTQELAEQWEERFNRAKGIKITTLIGARTDLGRVRENNEDKFEFFQPDTEDVLAAKGALYAVADGMGGHSAGQIASELGLKTIIKTYYSDNNPMIEASIKSAIREANGMIYETSRVVPDRSGMGTTVTVLILRGEEAFVAQVGDSRCYRLREGKIEQITEDHSWVAEQVKRGGMSEEEAMMSPYKNIITRSLGNAPSVEADFYSLDLRAGDVFLLCSDGLTGVVTDNDIKRLLKTFGPSKAATELVDMALNNGSTDNVTALVVAVKDIIREDSDIEEKPRRRGFARLFAGGDN